MTAKAELHVHLEGTAPPSLVRRLAARNGIELPAGLFANEDTFAWTDFLERPAEHLDAAPVVRAVAPEQAGVVAGMDCRAVGLVITGLGGNRATEADRIDPAVGLTEIAPVGAEVGPDRPLAVVHARDEAGFAAAEAALRASVRVGEQAPEERPAVAGRIEA